MICYLHKYVSKIYQKTLWEPEDLYKFWPDRFFFLLNRQKNKNFEMLLEYVCQIRPKTVQGPIQNFGNLNFINLNMLAKFIRKPLEGPKTYIKLGHIDFDSVLMNKWKKLQILICYSNMFTKFDQGPMTNIKFENFLFHLFLLNKWEKNFDILHKSVS